MVAKIRGEAMRIAAAQRLVVNRISNASTCYLQRIVYRVIITAVTMQRSEVATMTCAM